MKTKDQIEFIKGLISAHFDKGYCLLQVKDTNEHNAKREKQNTVSLKKKTIDLVHKTINGKKATDEELYATLFPPRKGLFSPIKEPILDLNN